MIVDNRLKFGYGDISVRSNGLTRTMYFQQFKPPGICGDRVSEDVEYIGNEIELQFSYEEYCEFCKKLNQVSIKELSEFIFKGYIFDFSTYKEESVRVCERHLNIAMSWYFQSMAA